MKLAVEPSLVKSLPPTVKIALSKMETEEQMLFVEEFKKKKRSLVAMFLCAVFLPSFQFLFLGRTGLFFAFWLTFAFAGIWYLVELFLTPRRVRDYNEDVAVEILRNQKLLV